MSNIVALRKIFQYEIKSEIEVLLDEEAARTRYIFHGMCLICYINNLISFLVFGLSNTEKHYNVIKVDIIVSKSNETWKINSIKDEIVQNVPVNKFPSTTFAH